MENTTGYAVARTLGTLIAQKCQELEGGTYTHAVAPQQGGIYA